MRALFFILLSIFSLFNISNAQKWKPVELDPDADAETEIHTEIYKNEIHLLFKSGGDMLKYMYSADRGKTWTKKTLRHIAHRTFEAGDIGSVVDANGNYSIAYFLPEDRSVLSKAVVVSHKKGDNWINDTIFKPGKNVFDGFCTLGFECDSKGALHVVFNLESKYHYYVMENNVWTAYVPPIFESTEFGMCIDKNDRIHIMGTDAWNVMKYAKQSQYKGGWVYENPGFKFGKFAAIDVDTLNHPHIIFDENNEDGEAVDYTGCYAYKDPNSGKWIKIVLEQIDKEVDGLDDGMEPANIEVDENNTVHLIYIPVGKKDSIYYASANIPVTTFKKEGVLCKKTFYSGSYVTAKEGLLTLAYIGGLTEGIGDKLIFAMREYNVLAKKDSIKRTITEQGIFKAENTTVTVEVWDNQVEDGDAVSILLDDQKIIENKTIEKKTFTKKLSLEKGKTYLLQFHSESEGKQPPCTATIRLTSGKNILTTVITSNTKNTGAVKILVPEDIKDKKEK